MKPNGSNGSGKHAGALPKTILITGCASGIGRSLADALYRQGHRILMTDVDSGGLERAAAELGWTDSNRAWTRALDVRDPVAWHNVVRECVGRWEVLDVALNVAGCLTPAWAHQVEPETVHRIVDVNVKGLMFGTNSALRVMVQQRHGHIVNIASMGGVVPVPGIAVYSASKHAARAYSIAVAQEARAFGVYVSAVCPAVVATPMMDIQVDREEAAVTFSSKRALTVAEVTHAVLTQVLPKKPIEHLISASGTSEIIAAKVANCFPDLAMRFGAQTRAAGRKNQLRLRASRT